MPKAAHTPTTSRRDLLTGSGAVLALGALPLADADDELLRRCLEADALDRETARMCAAADDLGVSTPAYDAIWSRIDPLMERWHAAIAAIVALPARTPDGVRAKAALLRNLVPTAPDGAIYHGATTQETIAWSLTADLLCVSIAAVGYIQLGNWHRWLRRAVSYRHPCSWPPDCSYCVPPFRVECMPDSYDAALVAARLAEAGATLLALRVAGVQPAGFRSGMPEPIREPVEAYGYSEADAPPPAPNPAAIARMDQALAWIPLIPADRVLLRRIVGARALTSPRTGKEIYSWRRLAEKVGASHEAVRLWHAQGIEIIVARLNQPGLCAASGGPVRPGARETAALVQRAIQRARAPKLERA